MIWLLALLACGDPAPPEPAGPAPSTEPEPSAPAKPSEQAPRFDFVAPERRAKSGVGATQPDELRRIRGILEPVVRAHGLDPDNPWAVGHAMLVFGAAEPLSNGVDPVEHLFAAYAETVPVGDETLVAFPRKRGNVRIEPHSDLLLKAMAEAGVPVDRTVKVSGADWPVSALVRHSAYRAWVDGGKVSFDSYNDTPWALQGLATYLPPHAEWTAAGGHEMGLDPFTHQVVDKLHAETAFMRDAMAKGEQVQKRGQGIFAYTCGGAHLLQGAAFSVARGNGVDTDRDHIEAQVPVLFWRYELELATVDAAIQQYPQYGLKLMIQRLKFLGHFLESAHKLEALGFYEADAAQKAVLADAEKQLVLTVDAMNKSKVFDQMAQIRASDEQAYLDLIGDSAHAIDGIDFALGKEVAY